MKVWSPGRVNLIGDHVDYMGGHVLPMAIQLGMTLAGEQVGRGIHLTSDREDEPAVWEAAAGDPAALQAPWGRLVAAVANEVAHEDPPIALTGRVCSSLPAGAGLSSSAALCVVVALALRPGFGNGSPGSQLTLAETAQRAEQAATGVPCGIMDQLAITTAVRGAASLIDCATREFTPVAIPGDWSVWVIDSGTRRDLRDSEYADRRRQAEAAAALVGPLPNAAAADIAAIGDSTIRRRARHVRAESRRVLDFAEAMLADDARVAGELMNESHRSLRDDFEVSIPALDDLCEEMRSIRGVHGARLTGAGFGGCVVALADEGAKVPGTRMVPSGPACALQ